eukprot:scaffold48024_cov57-Phaeocystis_antarctica.AAC.3
MPFSVSLNSKPIHQCSLLPSEHNLLQSASVALLPTLPLPSSWSANRRSKSWFARRKQRAAFGGAAWATRADSIGVDEAAT